MIEPAPGSTKAWMPLYVGDYLADTAHLTTEQSGAYLHLLMHYWRNGPLPDSDSALAQICKLTPDAWSNAQAMLRPFFFVGHDGKLHQKRSDRELEVWNAKGLKAKEKAQKAANSRWGENAPSIPPSNAPSNQQAMLEQCPSPSPSPIRTNTLVQQELDDTTPVASPLFEEKNSGLSQGPASVASSSSPKAPSARAADERAAVENVFVHYCETMSRNPNRYTLTPDRMRVGVARLRDCMKLYSLSSPEDAVPLLKAAVDGLATRDWSMGRDPKSNGMAYNDWTDHIFKSEAQMQKCWELADKAGLIARGSEVA